MIPAYDKRAIQDAAVAARLNIPRMAEATQLPVETVVAIFNGSRHVELSDLMRMANLLDVISGVLWKKPEPAAEPERVDFEILLKNRKRPFWRVVDEFQPNGRGNAPSVTKAAAAG